MTSNWTGRPSVDGPSLVMIGAYDPEPEPLHFDATETA